MAKEMRVLLKSLRRAHVWVGLGMLLPGCTDGVIPLMLLGGQDGGSDGAESNAGAGGGAGGTGNSGGRGGEPSSELRAGAGGTQDFRGPFCDPPWEPDAEAALLDAFNDAFANGRLCPRATAGRLKPLVADMDLQSQARWVICYSPPSPGIWGKVPRTTTYGWLLSDTASLEDAKNTLLNDDGVPALCADAERTTYRAIGVAHTGESWSVLISPGPTDDMRRDDMQKP